MEIDEARANLRQNIRRFMKDRRWTWTRMSQETGISRPTLQNMTITSMHINNLLKIGPVLHMTVSELIGENKEPDAPAKRQIIKFRD